MDPATQALDFRAGKQNQVFQSSTSSRIIPWKPGEDIFVAHDNDQIVTNVAISCSFGSTDFSWGYEGSSPFTLAINILNQFVPPGKDGYKPIDLSQDYPVAGASNLVSKLAFVLADKFEKQLIAPALVSSELREQASAGDREALERLGVLSREFRLKAETIEAWIRDNFHYVREE